jgi:hypothetical protein
LGWLVFIRASFGSFDMPYTSNLKEMHGENFGLQLGFLSKETARQATPAVLLAVVALFRAPRTCVVYVVWFLPFLILHALWRNPYDAWWQLRFLASAFPAVFLAAAVGARSLRDSVAALPVSTQARAVRYVLGVTGGLALIAYMMWSAFVSDASSLRTHDFDARYPLDVRRVLELVPPDAIIGAREHSTPLRLYGHLQSFEWCHADTPLLVDAALGAGRSVYAIFMLADENGCPEQLLRLRAHRKVQDVAVLPSGSRLVRVAGSSPEGD